MKTIQKAVIMSALALFAGCSRDDGFTDDGPTPVNFTAGIAATRTAAGGDTWTTTDKIGIFMLAADGDVLADNVAYNAVPGSPASAAAFVPVNKEHTIYYPQTGNVDFAAYYPWRTTPKNDTYIYKVSVAGQTNPTTQNACDVLYAKTTGVAKSKTVPVKLAFAHVLSKITLNVTLGEGFAGGGSVTAATFCGMPASATLDLQDGTLTADAAEDFAALKTAANSGVNATFTALLIPQASGGGRTVDITVNGETYTGTIPDTDDFAAGQHYVYPVTVNKIGVAVDAVTITAWKTNPRPPGAAELLDVVKIKAGTFLMGEEDVATPVHEVMLTQDFHMSKYQVTREQYAAFLNAAGVAGVPRVQGDNQYVTHTVSGYGPQNLFRTNQWGWTPLWNDVTGLWEADGSQPMIYVTWYGAKAYADWVGGALPTEAQWEYACRAGTTTPFYFGDDANQLKDYGWYNENSSGGPSPVGTKLPNDYGLYDMHGNVWEWCSDWYAAYDSGDVTDPTGSGSGDYRVLRGGGWSDDAQDCRSAFRYFNNPGVANLNVGFRVVFVQ